MTQEDLYNRPGTCGTCPKWQRRLGNSEISPCAVDGQLRAGNCPCEFPEKAEQAPTRGE